MDDRARDSSNSEFTESHAQMNHVEPRQPLFDLDINSRREGILAWISKRLTNVGDWLKEEMDQRKQMIGGIDNMWLLLADATGSEFNPVSTTQR